MVSTEKRLLACSCGRGYPIDVASGHQTWVRCPCGLWNWVWHDSELTGVQIPPHLQRHIDKIRNFAH